VARKLLDTAVKVESGVGIFRMSVGREAPKKINYSLDAMTLNLLQVYEIKAAVQQVFGLEAQVWVSGARLGNGEIDLYIEAEKIENVATKKRHFLDLLWDKVGCEKIGITIEKPQQTLEEIRPQVKQQRVRL